MPVDCLSASRSRDVLTLLATRNLYFRDYFRRYAARTLYFRAPSLLKLEGHVPLSVIWLRRLCSSLYKMLLRTHYQCPYLSPLPLCLQAHLAGSN